ncbi:MAG TPA: amidohydrolase family protein [Bacteroidales bacterium]|nr:amidohydrolase family protein [Bacteroidales bacterium]
MDKNVFFEKCEQISNNPLDRINNRVKNLINSGNFQIESHCHIFNKDYVPINYLELRMNSIPFSILNWLRTKFNWFNRLFQKDIITGIDDFIRNFLSNDMKEVLERLMSYFPDNFIFTPLTMDLAYGWDKLTSTKDFKAQLSEMRQLIKQDYPILPFMAIDPRNPELYSQFVDAFTGENSFFGVKVYPALGYLPSDPVLMDIYKVCEEKNIPVTTHCGGTIIRSMQGEIVLNGYILENGHLKEYSKTIENKSVFISEHDTNFLNDPDKWEPVIFKYPGLRLNIGHYGGANTWKKIDSRLDTITRLMQKGANVYADFSYDLESKKALKNFVNKMKDQSIDNSRSLFGTDFYMVTPLGDFHNILKKWKKYVPESIDAIMKKDNPYRFFFS